MRRILVTGAAGFIGANFVRYWLEQHAGDFVVIVDALTYAGNRANLDGVPSERCSLVEFDINDTETIKGLLRDQQLTTIVHFAAKSHVWQIYRRVRYFYRIEFPGHSQSVEGGEASLADRRSGI